METQKTTQDALETLVSHGTVAKIGATGDIKQWAQQMSREGYEGKIWYAPTQNQMRAADRLLDAGDTRYNVHQCSNRPEEPGYVYALVLNRR